MKSLTALIATSLLSLAAAHAQPSSTSMPLTEGEVMKVDKPHGEFVLKHGDLPNIGMPAMTMAFGVADKQFLEAFRKGDKVRFNAEMVKGKPTVTRMEATR